MAAIVVIMVGCVSRQKVTTTPGSKGLVDRACSLPFRYAYLEGVRQQEAGHYAAAYDLFRYCIELDSMQPDPYYQIAEYLSELGNDSMAMVSLERAVALNPQNDVYHETLAQWQIENHEYAAAIDTYETLFSNNRSRSDVLEVLLQLYQQEKNYSKMLSTIDRIEQVEGMSEELTLSKMHVYQLKGDKQAAYDALKAMADEHPNDVNYKVMMGNWLVQNNRPDEARDIFLKAAADEPNNEYVVASLYDYYRQQKDDSLTSVYRDRMLTNTHTAPRTKMTLLQQFISDNEHAGGDSTVVLNLFDRTMEASPKDADIAQLKTIYMTLKKMPEDEIDDAYAHVLDIAPDNAASRLSMVQTRWKREDWNGIIDLCLPALEYNPDEMAFCYFLGLAYYQKEERLQALDAFRRGVSQINQKSDKTIVSDFYALMGDILHQENRMEEAFAAYDSCLQWKPDNIGCLNNYAYYISESKEPDLKRAETMSHRTIIAEPNNTTYLDTYAWILYKQERFLEAKSYIDRAIENMDEDRDNSTILDHAGDIYLCCDDKNAAVEFWKKALEQADDKDEIRKKIKKNEK